jgi:hypothetical protein
VNGEALCILFAVTLSFVSHCLQSSGRVTSDEVSLSFCVWHCTLGMHFVIIVPNM